MFIDQDKKLKDQITGNIEPATNPFKGGAAPDTINYPQIGFYVFIGALLLVVLAVAFILLNRSNSGPVAITDQEAVNPNNNNQPIATGTLPVDFGENIFDEFDIDQNLENVKAEGITFGQFYEKTATGFVPEIKAYLLPLNVKTDVSNYYDISRKYNLDPYIEDLNNNGFAIMQNQFRPEADDFFSINRALIKKGIPILVTTDYIFYYYQNTLKQVYKEIERSVFYDNLWSINKGLYDVALARYKKRLSEIGVINDTVLEGERLETSFFAVTLQLLTPTKEQVNQDANFIDPARFNEGEAAKYNFDMPDSIRQEVMSEAEFIRQSLGTYKSPTLLYQMDYSQYQIPDNYKTDAKLNNFYLAMRWLNSVFPLYFQNSECPDCLLDYDDWLINMAGASYLTKDLSDNQELKNKWATIYKFISFFTGLRQELTYLDYQDTMAGLFGDNYEISDIFSNSNQDRETQLKKIQDSLGKKEFTLIEGGYDRSQDSDKLHIGMRLLQEPYWPNDYIMSQLTGLDKSVIYETEGEKLPFTACASRGANNYRCRGFGLDIINMLQEVNSHNAYFQDNIKYENYGSSMKELRGLLGKFDVHTWNNNIYWTTIDIFSQLLRDDQMTSPNFIGNSWWKEEKDYNTILGAWANLHLAEDYLENYYEAQGENLGVYTECNQYNYIEPNIDLYQELIAKNEMLIKVLLVLNVTENTNAATIELKNLNDDLKEVLRISEKELGKEKLTGDDCNFVTDFVGTLSVAREAKKQYTMDFPGRRLVADIDGLQLLAMIFNIEDKNIIAFGPIFNYTER